MADDLEARVSPALRPYLDTLLREGPFQLSYRLAQAPGDEPGDEPGLLVDFTGPDSGLLLANDGELLRAFEHLAYELLRLGPDDHHRLVFDCQGHRQLRLEELRTLAAMAAGRVRHTGIPYAFTPMNSRDRRIVHLALQGEAGLSSDSEGVGRDRHVVVRSLSAPRPGPAAGAKPYRRL
ncbi:MAG: protein jag [Terriglobales bacterium]